MYHVLLSFADGNKRTVSAVRGLILEYSGHTDLPFDESERSTPEVSLDFDGGLSSHTVEEDVTY